MNQKLLLGSTALVGAGILFAGAAPARAADPIKVVLGGYTEFGMQGATNDTLQNGKSNNGYTAFGDVEVHITATGVTDSGITYGSEIEFDLYNHEDADSSDANPTVADEANLFFSGGFGRVELGRQDGAEDVMFVGAEDAQSGTGGIDGDTRNLATTYHLSLGDSAKGTYFTPRIGGFQLGASAIPDESDDGGLTDGFGEGLSAGANWVGAFGGLDLSLSAVAEYVHSQQQNPVPSDPGVTSGDDQKDYAVGGLIGLGGLSAGLQFGQRLDFDESTFGAAGLKYKFGAASASVGYVHDDPDEGSTQNVYVVSGDIGLMPGVTLKADVSYNDNDPWKHTDGEDSGGTTAGVLSVQMDY
jgi:hypothetical protein